MTSRSWKIPAPEVVSIPDGYRVALEAHGSRFFIESDHPLVASAESAISAFFLPAISAERRIVTEGPVDETFYTNMQKVEEIASEWWGWTADKGRLDIEEFENENPRKTDSAMFFTGGVDSFCTLRRNLGEVKALVNVHGFDIKLADKERFEKAQSMLHKVAIDLGIEVIFVATDLRSNRLFNRISWEITHVSALAAIAHTLQESFGRILIASTDVSPPWGSNPDLDPLFGSSSLEIVNDGSSLTRLDKVRLIADWPLVHRHLKVCWENRSSQLNCGICEKCVRTQAQFAAAESLHLLSCFPEGRLSDRIEGLRGLSTHHTNWWREIRDAVDQIELRQAIDRLLNRSATVEKKSLVRRLFRF